jgi:hypothetical protein
MSARKDNRPMVEFYVIENYKGANQRVSAAIIEYKHHLSAGPYTRRADAKRGMERFLRRIGADPSAVRWEGEE